MKIELLAPAGTMEAFHAALIAGADAIYLGGQAFGARSFAGNFSNEELQTAVREAHLYGVKIYVTVNTLVYQEETEQFFLYLDFLYQIGVDALIVQDLGMMDYIRQVYPDMELHASTQMHIHTKEGVQQVEAWGLKRVVLARETSLEEIKEIRDNSHLELEIFVHGALCFSYSGQCLMSSMIGSRSGNRGTCSQCCRMKYQLEKDGTTVASGYLMSTKDLNVLPHLQELLEVGVNSLKIEGRMKRPEYVYGIVSLYRKAIDSYQQTGTVSVSEEDIKECAKLFHRQFTKGFLNGEEGSNITFPLRPNHIGIPLGTVVDCQNGSVTIALEEKLRMHDGIRILNEREDQGGIVTELKQKGKHVTVANAQELVTIPGHFHVQKGDLVRKTSDRAQLDRIQEALQTRRTVPISGILKGTYDQVLEYQVSDGTHAVTVKGTLPLMHAEKVPSTREMMQTQLAKLGATVYELATFECHLPTCFIPVKELNELRRKAVLLLDQKRLEKPRIGKQSYSYQVKEYFDQPGFTYLVTNPSELTSSLPYDTLYVKEAWYQSLPGKQVIPKLKRVHPTSFLKEALIGEVGSIGPNKISDTTLNVTNAYTVAFLHNQGIKRVTLSLELTQAQIKNLVEAYQSLFHKKPNLEVVIACLPEVMISKCRLLTQYRISSPAFLIDEKGRKFPVTEDEEGMHLFHFEPKIVKDPEDYFSLGITKLRKEGF